MDLHVRKIFWTSNGWPVVSPERYAWEDNATVSKDSMHGQWEKIVLNYKVVPGFADEQLYPDFQESALITIDGGGTINGNEGTWTYTAPWLQLTWSSEVLKKFCTKRKKLGK